MSLDLTMDELHALKRKLDILNPSLSSKYDSWLTGGLEAINYQTTSKVGQKMVALFEKCYAIRDKEYSPEDQNEEAVSADIAKLFSIEMPKIWKQEFNLNIVRVITNTGAPAGYVAISYSLPDIVVAELADDIVYGAHREGGDEDIGTGLDGMPEKYIQRLEALVQNAVSFDKVKGKLTKYTWPVQLYLDVQELFFADLFISLKHTGFTKEEAKLTPREIAAIYLHEAGHALVYIELLSYAHCVEQFKQQAINGFLSSKPSLDSIRSLCVRVLDPLIKQAQTNPTNKDKPSYKHLDICKNIVTKIVSFCDYIQSAREGVKPSYTPGLTDPEIANMDIENVKYATDVSTIRISMTVICRIFGILLNLLMTILHPFIIVTAPITILSTAPAGILFFLSMGLIVGEVLQVLGSFNLEKNSSSDNRKVGDLKNTAHNIYKCERLADDFAARHGFGGDIASGLYKITDLMMYGSPSERIRENTLLNTLNAILYSILDFRYRGITSIYENDDQRIRRLLQDQIGRFKNPKISGQARDAAIAQAKKTLAIMDKMKTDYYNRTSMISKIVNMLGVLGNPADWIRIFTTGRLIQEYEKQFNQLENIGNNLLFLTSAQLKQIASNMK